jgi:two-component system OmpR family sensor kinase
MRARAFPRAIRWRLLAWHVLLLAALLAGFGWTVHELEGRKVMQRVDGSLSGPLSMLHRALARGRDEPGGRGRVPGPGQDLPPPRGLRLDKEAEAALAEPGMYYVAWSRTGERLAASANAPLEARLPDPSGGTPLVPVFQMAGERREAFIFTPPGECPMTGRAIGKELAEWRRDGWRLALLGGLILVAGVTVDGWLVGRALRPIGQISATADRIARGNLAERIGGADADSELGRLIAVLNQMFDRLQSVFDQQQRFTADAAHELRTPLTVLLAETQRALGRERDAGAYRETIEVCQRAASRMDGVIESLLALARIEGDGESEGWERCDLCGIAGDAVKGAEALAAQSGVKIGCAGEPTVVRAREGQLTQIVTNLIANAIHYNQEGGEVRLAIRAEAGWGVLEVGDTGPGIAEAHLAHVFERFYRVDESRNRNRGGVGLGLAICQSLAVAQGGELSVKSRVGEGSVFTLRVPLAGGEVGAA